MAARIIFCIESRGASQQPSLVRNLAELSLSSPQSKAVAFQAIADGTNPLKVRCSDPQHIAVLREAVAEQARPNSTACFIILVEDRARTPVFHAEKVATPESQASFDDSWAQLQAA
ncbi:hypothetical protein [uncultured Bosea sp.]|uniref:hypothetical protein n=1 Tax=uncultured Bosea sp. TaxID=211457 RepID=UPI0025E3E02C|nr:hypothetical protein [uncultured Bosea sp.]